MNSTPPVGSGNPYSGISEFELPNETRKLVDKIMDELFNPCKERLINAKERQNRVHAEIARPISRLNSICADAEEYLRTRGIAVPPPPLPAKAETNVPGLPPMVDGNIQRLRDIEAKLSNLKGGFVLPYWPKNNAARIAIVVLTPCYFIGLLWFVLVFISRLIGKNQVVGKYRALRAHCEELRADLGAIGREADERFSDERKKIGEDFKSTSESLHKQVEQLWTQSVYAGADWDSAIWQNWSPDPSPEFAARIGILETAGRGFSKLIPGIDFNFKLPALIPFSEGRCLLLNTSHKGRDEAAGSLMSVMIRVLANTPPGKARFVLIDPVGLGHNVADFIHLGDFNKDLISGKAWSEPQHIEQQLALLMEHMETVIQTCLRKEFASIQDYNRERHEVAQPFRFLVVNDFPVNFNEASARRLLSIVKNGPRCGVFAFISCDKDKKPPYGFNMKELEDAATNIEFIDKPATDDEEEVRKFVWQDENYEDFDLTLDKLPPQNLVTAIVKKSGELAIPAMKVDVPFEKVLATASLGKESWFKASAAENLKVPIGPAGARALQEMTLGGEQEAHALLVGRTGSGKTNLMHVIVTALALKYSPKEVQLYLIDFKGGVGFKRYAQHKLPHAKVIAIESEREFGMSVLRGLDSELKSRSEKFRSVEVDNLSAYRAKFPTDDSMPRILLVVDEFQEFFSENDDLSQQAKTIFERLARQGRSYGIHFLLATQSLSGSAQLPSSIMGQIKVRIALPCSESDSRLILADDNKAARALSLPGEAIYNPMGGLVEGNNRFQVARFSDDDLPKYLAGIAASTGNGNVPIIFEGNESARIENCAPLKELLESQNWPASNKHIDAWLGEPVALMPPVNARLRRQSGGNLMILARDESEGVGLCMAATINILSQQPPEKMQICIADFTTADSEWAGYTEEIVSCFPGKITIAKRQRDVPAMLASIAKEVQSRGDDLSAKESIYLILQGMHRIKTLREDVDDDDGNNAVELLKTILRDGPEVGVHVVAWADTWGNITRGLDRRTIGEFGLRVASVMDSGDSMNFLDNLAASKISKPHRVILYDEDRPGQLTTFRPYSLPPATWLKEVGERLRERIAKSPTPPSNPPV